MKRRASETERRGWLMATECCSYRKCNRGRNWSWNRWTREKDNAALLDINSCHTSPCFTAPEIQTDCADPVCLPLSSQSFLPALGKEIPWVSLSCTLAFFICLYCKISLTICCTIFWYAFQIPSFHFDDNEFGSVCSDQGQSYHY